MSGLLYDPVADRHRRLFGDDVRRCALYLDKIKPDWWQLDTLKLDLWSSKNCVCGQNGLDWIRTAAEAGVNKSVFGSPTCMTGLWLEEIAKRMPAPVREPVPA